MINEKQLEGFIQEAKKISKKNKDRWELILIEMITWSLVNVIHRDPDFLEDLKANFVDGYKKPSQKTGVKE